MFIDDERTPGLMWIAFGGVATGLAVPLLRVAPMAVAVPCIAAGAAMIGVGVWSIRRVMRER